jgi:hypothetical protein
MASTTGVTSERRTGELDLFRLYLDQAGRHPLLTKQDEIDLSQAYEAGLDAQLKLADCDPDDPARPDLEAIAERGEWARRKMIESNLRLVVSIARRFSATGLPLGDLVQEGNLGLLRAVEKFDWRKGFKFSTYATWWIRGSGAQASISAALSTPTQAPFGRCLASSPSPHPTSSTGVSASASRRLATRPWTSGASACRRRTDRASRKRPGSSS